MNEEEEEKFRYTLTMDIADSIGLILLCVLLMLVVLL
jgi:cbb3-type cytochrome oxidase subunit 3